MSSRESNTPPSRLQEDGFGANAGDQEHGSHARKKRVRNWSADDRAAHRVFERSRREAFKNRLMSLASLIPSLEASDTSRLSKHVVIDESINLHKEEQDRLKAAVAQINAVLEERTELLAEVNTWRARAGITLREARTLEPLPVPSIKQMHQPQSGSEYGSNNPLPPAIGTAAVPEDAQLMPVPETLLNPDLEADTLLGFEGISQSHLGASLNADLDDSGLTRPSGLPSSQWDIMASVGLETNSIPEEPAAFDDIYGLNVLDYSTASKSSNTLPSSRFHPHEGPFQQQPINIINSHYMTDPHLYGQ